MTPCLCFCRSRERRSPMGHWCGRAETGLPQCAVPWAADHATQGVPTPMGSDPSESHAGGRRRCWTRVGRAGFEPATEGL